MRKISFSFLSVYIQHGNEEKYSFLNENQHTLLKNVKKLPYLGRCFVKTLFYALSCTLLSCFLYYCVVSICAYYKSHIM